MRLLASLAVVTAVSLAPSGPTVAGDSAIPRSANEQGVVGLAVTYQEWNEDRPWAKLTPQTRDASAVVVDASHLLTTAEMVVDATLIRLVVSGIPRPVEPRVVVMDPEINLALLAVDDAAALEGLEPVTLAARIPTSGVLRTVRWRGQQLESVQCRVTRFEVERGWGTGIEHVFLHLRTDLVGGGWAEPVFRDGELAGITVSQSKQTSRAIPVGLIRAFLERTSEPGPYVGFPSMGLKWQVNRDPAVARFLGQDGEPRGVLVRQVSWGGSACGVIRPRDILLQLDGHPIDAAGYYLDERLGRLRFAHLLVERFRPGDTVTVRVLRGGEEIDLAMTVRDYPDALDLVPYRRDGGPPFVVAGGLVFRELDRPYLRTWGQDWSNNAPISLLSRYHLEQAAQTPDRRRIVLITSVLPDPYNVGYQSLLNEVVERVNGRPVDSVSDVVHALAEPQHGFHIIELSADSSRGQVVLDAGAFESATARILEAYHVPQAMRVGPEALPPGGGACPDQY